MFKQSLYGSSLFEEVYCYFIDSLRARSVGTVSLRVCRWCKHAYKQVCILHLSKWGDGIRICCLLFVTESKTWYHVLPMLLIQYFISVCGSSLLTISRIFTGNEICTVSLKAPLSLSSLSLFIPPGAFSALHILWVWVWFGPWRGVRCCLWTGLFPLLRFLYLFLPLCLSSCFF